MPPFLIQGMVAFFFGAIIGSFLNVWIVRTRAHMSLWGRSRCPTCQYVLRPRHLVPIVSWIVLRGRCVSCQRPIHVQYPLVELLSGCLCVIAWSRYPELVQGIGFVSFVFEFLFSISLLAFAVFDVRWRLLPLEWMIVAAIGFGVAAWAMGLSVMSIVLGVLVCGGFLGILSIISRGRWVGAGDPWLGTMIGAALGWPRAGFALYFAYVIGGVLMLLALAVHEIKRNQAIPFAPFLAGGALCALWFGPWIQLHLFR